MQEVRGSIPRGSTKTLKRVHTHLLRHSFITNALRGGMNPIMVANIAGHSSLRMIERVYSHLDQGDAYDALMKYLSTTA